MVTSFNILPKYQNVYKSLKLLQQNLLLMAKSTISTARSKILSHILANLFAFWVTVSKITWGHSFQFCKYTVRPCMKCSVMYNTCLFLILHRISDPVWRHTAPQRSLAKSHWGPWNQDDSSPQAVTRRPLHLQSFGPQLCGFQPSQLPLHNV